MKKDLFSKETNFNVNIERKKNIRKFKLLSKLNYKECKCITTLPSYNHFCKNNINNFVSLK